MSEQTFGPRRCRDSRKPSIEECPIIHFYCCPVCHKVYTVSGFTQEGSCQITCCSENLQQLEEKSIKLLEVDESAFTYKITGGYNDNAVQVRWKTQNKQWIPRWIYLKTFTGGYLKYVKEGKRPPMIFALADLDAFAYCDESPCIECTFRCKRGFVIYIYVEELGLISIPLDKMNPYWQS